MQRVCHVRFAEREHTALAKEARVMDAQYFRVCARSRWQ